LCNYADQLAWVNSRSKDSKIPRRESLKFDMPNIDYCYYVAEMAMEYGFKTEWSELNAWNSLTGSNLNRFESKAVYLMSVTYQNKHGEYDGKDAPRPFVGNTRPDSNLIKIALRGK